MGITGLIGLVENASTSVNITQLNGSVCVIDGYGWLHKACYGCAEHLYTGHHTDQYVYYCLKKTQMLIDAGIKPIVVFDGQRLPAKEVTHKIRRSMRQNMRQKVELLLTEGKESKAKELMRNCVEVTPEMARNLMSGLRSKGIDFIVSPFEADAQMAYLVNNGFADFVVTEDSDLLVYNCRLCLFKLDSSGNGRLVDMSLIKNCLGKEFDSKKFRYMSILSGCDYLPNLPGIGLQRAKKFFKLTANTDLKSVLYKVPNYLKMSKKVKITEQYVNDFIKADNTFKYQLVFCPKQRKLVPLTPYDSDVDINDLKYAGTHFDVSLGQHFPFEYAIGNVDTKTLKIVDSFSFEPKSDSIWSEDWISYKKSLAKNVSFLHKFNQNKVLKVSEDNNCHKRKNSENKSNEDNKQSEYFTKRLKVNENGLINCSQLFKQYSSQPTEDKNISSNTTTPRSQPRNQIYSRNIFKVNAVSSDEPLIQSKYFSSLRSENSSTQMSVESNHINTRMRPKSVELSQLSLNSSGNTEIESSFDETLTMSDTERSEISETSDEEIRAINSFTKLKPKKGSVKRLEPLNSTLITPSNKTDIRSYFNTF